MDNLEDVRFVFYNVNLSFEEVLTFTCNELWSIKRTDDFSKIRKSFALPCRNCRVENA